MEFAHAESENGSTTFVQQRFFLFYKIFNLEFVLT